MAPSEASWAALMVRYTACLRYGAPQALIADRGGASISHEFEAVCRRLPMAHQTLISTQGESYMHVMETPVNIQRRLYDDQFSLRHTPGEWERAHQAFIQLYNTTAHQGLLHEGLAPPSPLAVLAEAKGRMLSPDELAQKFSRALFPRTTNRYGGVTLHRYHFYVEAGWPKTQVLRWVYGEQGRAMFEHVVFAAYHCHDDGQDRHVKAVRNGVVYATPFASPQGALIPVNAQASLVLYRPQPRRGQAQVPVPAQPLWLFERMYTA